MKDKMTVRQELQAGPLAKKHSNWGRAAENLRRLHSYRDAATVFASPHASLHQARINCLADGKNLIMPGPSMRNGFYILPAGTTPFKSISLAVTYKGLEKFGKLLKVDSLSKMPVGLLLTDSLAVDGKGSRIGDGKGYFDLCCALLQELGGLQPGHEVLTLVQEDQISTEILPQDEWDIKMTTIVTPAGAITIDSSGVPPRILWDKLPHDRVRRIDPLFKLFQKRQGNGQDIHRPD